MTTSRPRASDVAGRYSKATDGIDHINISPQGKTELGVLLAHYTESPFIHEYLGPFDSMEGYWYYVKGEKPDDKLRSLSGKQAYLYGKELPSIRRQFFREIIMDGNYFKIDQNERLKKLLVESELPLTQYYNYGKHSVAINPTTMPWLVPDFETLRHAFIYGVEREIVSYEDYQKILSPVRRVKK